MGPVLLAIERVVYALVALVSPDNGMEKELPKPHEERPGHKSLQCISIGRVFSLQHPLVVIEENRLAGL